MVIVERFPVWQLVLFFIATVGPYVGLMYYQKMLEEQPPDKQDADHEDRLKTVKMVTKVWPFVAVVGILAWFMLR